MRGVGFQMKYRVWVGGLPTNIEESELFEIFSKYGKVHEVNIRRSEQDTYAFITYMDRREAETAIRSMDRSCRWGAPVKVSISKDFAPNGPRGPRVKTEVKEEPVDRDDRSRSPGPIRRDRSRSPGHERDRRQRRPYPSHDGRSMPPPPPQHPLSPAGHMQHLSRDPPPTRDYLPYLHASYDGYLPPRGACSSPRERAYRYPERAPWYGSDNPYGRPPAALDRRVPSAWEMPRHPLDDWGYHADARPHSQGYPGDPRMPGGYHRLTVEHIPEDMSWLELMDLGKIQGGPSVTHGEVFMRGSVPCGMLEFVDRADMLHCISVLHGRKIQGGLQPMRVYECGR